MSVGSKHEQRQEVPWVYFESWESGGDAQPGMPSSCRSQVSQSLLHLQPLHVAPPVLVPSPRADHRLITHPSPPFTLHFFHPVFDLHSLSHPSSLSLHPVISFFQHPSSCSPQHPSIPHSPPSPYPGNDWCLPLVHHILRPLISSQHPPSLSTQHLTSTQLITLFPPFAWSLITSC